MVEKMISALQSEIMHLLTALEAFQKHTSDFNRIFNLEGNTKRKSITSHTTNNVFNLKPHKANSVITLSYTLL